jgi:hypothetical protein
MKKPKFTYIAAPGGRITDQQARVVGSEFERIENTRGCLKAPEVVDEARPRKSPLHPFFTWSDTKAAEAFREQEAKQLIRSVVLVTVENESAPPCRAFVSVESKASEEKFEGRGYISVTRALTDEEYYAQVLQSAYDELQAFRERYKHLKELGVVLAAIEELV